MSGDHVVELWSKAVVDAAVTGQPEPFVFAQMVEREARKDGALWALRLPNECWCDCCRKGLGAAIESDEQEVCEEVPSE